MSTLSELLAEHTELSGADANHLQRLVAEWQLLADLSFADLQLWVPAGESFVCVAQGRPNTATTVFPADLVGSALPDAAGDAVARTWNSGDLLRDHEARWLGDIAVRWEAVPVRSPQESPERAVIAVLTRVRGLSHLRSPSPLESAYQDSADALCQMIAEGRFPGTEENPKGLSTPRVGDGFVRVDAAGSVSYASPNALSAYHRLGWSADLPGENLADITRQVLTDPFESADAEQMIRDAVAGTSSAGGMRMEVDARRASALLRAIALTPHHTPAGALVLIRDVTEVKRRDRALLSKDATIREIHHRVKNNLQSVSALLRLQARRTGNTEARQALEEAVRRVASIALVHETLSASVDEQVDLDAVVDQLVPVMADVAAPSGASAQVRRVGKLGVLPSDLATPLVMVLTELIQNAIEHGFDDAAATGAGAPGLVEIDAERSTRKLVVTVRDNGIGLPEGFDPERSDRLGLQIVHTLVKIELSGTLQLRGGADGGTDAVLTVPLH
jgi:two-component sensor histidine kinase